jgi:hypothetical protein
VDATVQVRWARWWIWLWGIVAVGLLISLRFFAFKWWAVAAGVGFGTMEGIGLVHDNDPYPPLTHVIRNYVPRWIAFSAIYAITGGAAAKWFHLRHAAGIAAVVGLLGWFNAHFDVVFDEPAKQQERAKYRRIYEHTIGRMRRGATGSDAAGS